MWEFVQTHAPLLFLLSCCAVLVPLGIWSKRRHAAETQRIVAANVRQQRTYQLLEALLSGPAAVQMEPHELIALAQALVSEVQSGGVVAWKERSHDV